MKFIEKNTFFKYLPLHLALLIPIPGRFVFGFTIVIENLLLTLVGTLINSLINKLKLRTLRTVILLITLFSTTIFFRQILVVTYTEIALTLGFFIFLPPVSLFLIQILYSDLKASLPIRLKENLIQSSFFSFNALLVFLFRDIAGYGTFTFFSKNHMFFEKVLFKSDSVGIFSFFATLPGAMILTDGILFCDLYIHEKIKIVKRVER